MAAAALARTLLLTLLLLLLLSLAAVLLVVFVFISSLCMVALVVVYGERGLLALPSAFRAGAVRLDWSGQRSASVPMPAAVHAKSYLSRKQSPVLAVCKGCGWA